MDDLREEVTKLRQEVDQLKEIVMKLAGQPQQPKTEEKVDPPRPRSGNFKPEDVSIEKFFYAGKK